MDHMDPFAAVLRRVRRHGRDTEDANFDDYSSGDEADDRASRPNEALVRDAAATVAAAPARVRERGASHVAAAFAEHLSTSGGQPA